jgi:hypothetical protein
MDSSSEFQQQILPYIQDLKTQLVASPHFVKAELLFTEAQKLPPYVITLAALVLSTICLYVWRSSRPAKLDFPIMGDPSDDDFRPALEEGAKKVWGVPRRSLIDADTWT